MFYSALRVRPSGVYYYKFNFRRYNSFKPQTVDMSTMRTNPSYTKQDERRPLTNIYERGGSPLFERSKILSALDSKIIVIGSNICQ
jgi:hypothetical protein